MIKNMYHNTWHLNPLAHKFFPYKSETKLRSQKCNVSPCHADPPGHQWRATFVQHQYDHGKWHT